MNFQITLKEYTRTYRINIEQFDVTDRSEKFRVIARNKTIILESNRPFFRNKGLKYRKPDWKVISGDVHRGSGLEMLQNKILEVVDKK
jgi:hypothetical protein